MDELRAFLNSLTLAEQREFAKKCGTTLNSLRVALAKNSALGTELSVAIELHSNGAVTRKQLHPDRWKYMWPELEDCPKRDS